MQVGTSDLGQGIGLKTSLVRSEPPCDVGGETRLPGRVLPRLPHHRPPSIRCGVSCCCRRSQNTGSTRAGTGAGTRAGTGWPAPHPESSGCCDQAPQSGGSDRTNHSYGSPWRLRGTHCFPASGGRLPASARTPAHSSRCPRHRACSWLSPPPHLLRALVTQDHLPISRSLTDSHLRSPFCSAKSPVPGQQDMDLSGALAFCRPRPWPHQARHPLGTR